MRIEVEKVVKLSVPIHHLESICIFGPSTISPPAMDLCWEHGVAINYLSETGYFQARVTGVADTSVTLRRAQFRAADDPVQAAAIARQVVAGKIQNARNSLLRAARETNDAGEKQQLERAVGALSRWRGVQRFALAALDERGYSRRMTLTEVRAALAELGLRPSRARGQNFLVDANILGIIVAQADIRADETILEIGPGLGVLTAALLARARRVVAIERDRRLCEYLRARFPGLELIEGDAVAVLGNRSEPGKETFGRPDAPGQRPAHSAALSPSVSTCQPFNVSSLSDPVKVVANLPYRISTSILERLVEGEHKPRAMVLLLQREVAQRLAARPRQKEYGALTLFTQLRYHVTIAHAVSRRCFYPVPRVDSTIVVLDRRDPRVALRPGAPFHDIVRQGFGQRRKMLRKLVPQAEWAFGALGVPATTRAEELSLEQWIGLANSMTGTGS